MPKPKNKRPNLKTDFKKIAQDLTIDFKPLDFKTSIASLAKPSLSLPPSFFSLEPLSPYKLPRTNPSPLSPFLNDLKLIEKEQPDFSHIYQATKAMGEAPNEPKSQEEKAPVNNGQENFAPAANAFKEEEEGGAGTQPPLSPEEEQVEGAVDNQNNLNA